MTSTATPTTAPLDPYRLPRWVLPTRYDIELEPDLEAATFTGTPDNDDVGSYPIEVTATDAAGESASDAFVLSVLNVNDPPELVLPLADQVAQSETSFALALESGMFLDVDAGDVLAIQSGSPAP